MGDGGVAYQMNSFEPGLDNGAILRKAFGRFGTGVTVVTAPSPQGPIGMTANSFSSVSIDPPLVLWSPSKKSSRYPHFTSAQYFAIHVLSAQQINICNGFAKSANMFDDIKWAQNDQQVPIIDGCLACFECQLSAVHDAGDHSIVIGEVVRLSYQDGEPLLFCGGQFGAFQPTISAV